MNTQSTSIEIKRDHKSFRYYKLGTNFFVFDPIFLESPSETNMVNWLTSEMITEVRRDIWGDNNDPIECHTYLRMSGVSTCHNGYMVLSLNTCNPSVYRQDASSQWYYAGKLRLSEGNLPSQWPYYNQEVFMNKVFGI